MAKTASWIFGVIFVIAGVWGFFTDAAVLGFLAHNTISNIIHIVAGLLLLAMAGKASAGMVLKVVGIVYVIWGILGLVGMGEWSAATTTGTNWFYLIVGIVLAAIGFMNRGGSASPVSPAAPQM